MIVRELLGWFIASLGHSFFILAVFVWAWLRSYNLPDGPTRAGSRLRAVLLAFVVLLLFMPTVSRALLTALRPSVVDSLATWYVATLTISLLSSAAYATCWFLLLKLVLDCAERSGQAEQRATK